MKGKNFKEDVEKHSYKDLKASYKAISAFSKLKKLKIIEPVNQIISDSPITVSSKNQSFNFKVRVLNHFSLNDFNFSFLGFDLPLVLKSKKSTLYTKPKAVSAISLRFGDPRAIQGELSNLYSDEEASFRRKFLRLVLPVPEEVFTTDIRSSSYTDRSSSPLPVFFTGKFCNRQSNQYQLNLVLCTQSIIHLPCRCSSPASFVTRNPNISIKFELVP